MKGSLLKAGIPLGIVLISIGAAAVMVMSKKPPEKVEVEEKAFLVSAEPVALEDLNFVVKSQGTVMPRVETVLSAQVSGKVVSVSDAFIAGGKFKKGDILVQLEQADYMTDLKSAEAELARAQAALEEEEARGKVAAEEWRSVNKSVAPQLGLRKPQLAKEMANVRAAEAQLERAKRNLERSTIRAPYEGLVKAKNVDLGQFVGTGSQLGTIFSTEVAEVRIPLSDNDLAYLELPSNGGGLNHVSLTAQVAGKRVEWQGKLVRSEGVLDSQRRVIYAVAEVQDPYLRKVGSEGTQLKFGRFVQVEIIGNRGENMAVIPRNLLRLDGTVLVVGQDRKLKIRNVTVQRADAKFAYISSGLESGELIASSAIPNAYDGMLVRLPGDKDTPAEKDEPDVSATAIASSGG